MPEATIYAAPGDAFFCFRFNENIWNCFEPFLIDRGTTHSATEMLKQNPYQSSFVF